MTDQVAGGLDEPEELQPEQGALRLAAPEDTATRTDWERAAAGVLRKVRRLSEDDPDDAVWRVLGHTTYDGVGLTPLGTAEQPAPGSGPRPGRTGGWDVRVRVADDTDPLSELEGGATSLWVLAEHVPAGELASKLKGVALDLAPVVLESPSRAHAQALLALGPLHPDSNLGATDDDDLAWFARAAADAGVGGVVVEAVTVHEQGASDAQELGWLLARGAQVLRVLESAGIEPARAFRLLELRVAVTDEQFLGIAKLRALRRLWSRLAELCGVPDAPLRVHAVTSRPMTSAYDVHVNLLRATVAAFAAGVGGADALTVVPFDEPTGVVSPRGRRLARNLSALLVEESHVARVADPAGGAYAVEQLTADLCRVAWDELGRIEAEGKAPFLDRVAEVRSRREDDVARRQRPLTGLSAFADLASPPPPRRNTSYRYGAAFEALRGEICDQAVQLETLGTPAEYGARAAFMTNLFAAGGIRVELGEPTDGESRRVVCLVGSDPAYAAEGEGAAAEIRRRGAARVIVAGASRPWADDAFATGDDAVRFLTRTREALR